MKIKPNAAPSELSSPFFIKNKEFCSTFESFIASKNGTVKGQYNAWTYTIFGKINNPKNWDLKYLKVPIESGNLLVHYFYKNERISAIWSTKRNTTKENSFLIRKKKRFDFLNPKNKFLVGYDNYTIKSKNLDLKLIEQLKIELEKVIKSKELYKIDFSNNRLTIEIRTEKHYFDIFEKISQL